jgi:hypothetical protein
MEKIGKTRFALLFLSNKKIAGAQESCPSAIEGNDLTGEIGGALCKRERKRGDLF